MVFLKSINAWLRRFQTFLTTQMIASEAQKIFVKHSITIAEMFDIYREPEFALDIIRRQDMILEGLEDQVLRTEGHAGDCILLDIKYVKAFMAYLVSGFFFIFNLFQIN